MSWNNFLNNQKSFALKKFLSQVLEQKIFDYDDILDRISQNFTDKDLQNFANLVNDLLAAGYMKAMADYKEQLKTLGIDVKIDQPKLG